ncbi:unnamed protein product [Vicia faba]|uniref:Uncharacterized protein n=1 Tax=Vicia faba TaxID=3906 RepID=A0AAV0YM92_VICFA|nr:unnamed protein product [Vicia faba]
MFCWQFLPYYPQISVLKKLLLKLCTKRRKKVDMTDLPKKNDETDNRKDESDDSSKSKKVIYLNSSTDNQSGRRRKYPESDEESSRCIIPNNQKIRGKNPNQPVNMAKNKETDASKVSPIFQPQHENQRNERDLTHSLYTGVKFTGVIDGVIPGGYLLTIRVGNGLGLQGKAFFSSHILAQIGAGANVNVPWACPTNVDHTQKDYNQNLNQEKENDHLRNTCNQEPFRNLDIYKNLLEIETNDELHSYYSDIEMPHSSGSDVPDPLLVTNKFTPIVLKQVNPLTGVPVDQPKSHDKGKQILKDYYTPNPKDYRIGIDPFLPKKFPSPAISISPPCDGVRKRYASTEILVTEQYARLSQPGLSSLNRNTSQQLLLKNNEKVVQYQPVGVRKRNVTTEILVPGQYARLSQSDPSSPNRNISQHAFLNNNENVVQFQPTAVRKRNMSTELLDTEQYVRLSHPDSSSYNQNINQHEMLKNDKKVLQYQPNSVRKRNISTENFDTEQYARISNSGTSSLNRNTSQHALLKNNEKVVQCQPTDVRKRNVSTEILDTEQYARFSQPGSIIEQQENKNFIDLEREKYDDDDNTKSNSTS